MGTLLDVHDKPHLTSDVKASRPDHNHNHNMFYRDCVVLFRIHFFRPLSTLLNLRSAVHDKAGYGSRVVAGQVAQTLK